MAIFDTHRDPGDENPERQALTTFALADVPVGGALRIKTRNSTYEIRKQAGGITWRIEQTKVSPEPDAYKLSPNPVVVHISNSNLAVGLSLWFERESPIKGADRLTRTSTIKSIEEIK